VPTISWAPDWQPYTILGDERWADYEVSADVYLNPIESAGVMGRVNHVGTGYGIIPKGYYLQLAADGELKLVVVRGKIDKKALVGDAEQQALIRAGADAGAGGEKVLAATRMPGVGAGQWHRLTLQFRARRSRPAWTASQSWPRPTRCMRTAWPGCWRRPRPARRSADPGSTMS
jgi:galactosylceramidase